MSKDSHISTRLRGIRARIPGRLFTDPGDNPFLFLVTMFPAAENIISEEGGYRSVDACYLVQDRIPTLLLEPPVNPQCLPCLQGDPLAVTSTVWRLSRVVCACVRVTTPCHVCWYLAERRWLPWLRVSKRSVRFGSGCS